MAKGRKAPTKYVMPKSGRHEVFDTDYLIHGNRARAGGHSLSGIAKANKRLAQKGFTRGTNAADVSMNNPPNWK
jgi:hypothetical protein